MSLSSSICWCDVDASCASPQVVQQAHAVVLASGTLSPIASLTRQLFPSTNPEAISHFSCGHVVPKERLLAIALAQVLQLDHATDSISHYSEPTFVDLSPSRSSSRSPAQLPLS